jgi:hypothetical protein
MAPSGHRSLWPSCAVESKMSVVIHWFGTP